METVIKYWDNWVTEF